MDNRFARCGRIRIVTDSVADIPWETARSLGIKVVPIYVLIGERSYRDDGSLDRGWFYENLDKMRPLPQTAAPSLEEFHEAYRALVSEGAEEIIGLFLTRELSSIYDNAYLAARQFKATSSQASDVSIHIIETGQVSMGVGWLAIAAAKAAAGGAMVEEIIQLVKDMRARTVVLGVLDSLEYLWHGGRVGGARAWVGDLLRIKALLSFQHGKAALAGRVRTYRRALASLAKSICQFAPLEHLALLHSHVKPDVIANFREMLMDCASLADDVSFNNDVSFDNDVSLTDDVSAEFVPLVEVTPVFGTHVGPRAVGVAAVFTKGPIVFD
jgi:DegV family protein with EDD domain